MAWQQNAAGVYYDLETGEVSPAGSPPPGFVAPTVNTTDEFVDESVWDGEGSYSRKVANPNYVAPKPTTLEGILQQYNQSNFDIGSTAALIRQLGQQSGLSEAELVAAVPVFGDEHRGAYNSGYTEGSNYNAIAQRAVSDALRTKGVDPSRFNQATQGFVDQGTQQAQERWQGTQEDDDGMGVLSLVALAVAAYVTGGAALAAFGGEAAAVEAIAAGVAEVGAEAVAGIGGIDAGSLSQILGNGGYAAEAAAAATAAGTVAGEGALSATEFAANAGVGASNTTGALSSFAESLKSFTDLIPPELKSAMDSLPPAAKKALVGAITNPQDPIGGAIKGGVLGATGGELSSALTSAGVDPSIAKMLTQSATQFIQTGTIDPTKLAMSALTPEISGGLKDLGVPPEALNAATNAVKQLVSTGQINAEQLALGAGNEAVSKALTDAGIPSNYVKLVGTAVVSAVTGNNFDLGSIASAVLSGDKKQRSQDSEDEAIARDVQDETDRQEGAIAKVQTAADQETEDQVGAIAKEQATTNTSIADTTNDPAGGKMAAIDDENFDPNPYEVGVSADEAVDYTDGGSDTNADTTYTNEAGVTDSTIESGDNTGNGYDTTEFTAEQLKAEAERLKDRGQTPEQIKKLLGATAKKLGINLDSGKSIVGAIGDWIKDNPALAALSGGLVAAILADRNKEQKLTTTRSLTPENQKAVSGAITDLANSNAYKPTLGMTGDQTGALATLKGVTDTKYTNPMAAGLATNQQGAIDLASKKQGDQQATIEAAKVGTVNAAKGIPTANLTPYMNQYTMQALNPQLEQYDRDTQKQQQGLSSQAVKAGAFGGSRFGLMGTELDRNRDFVRQGTVNTAMKDAFDRATTLYGVDKARELQSAGQLQSIATAGGALESQDVKDLASTGALQQTTDQNAKDKAYAEFLRQQNAQAGYAGTALETANTVAKSDIGQNQFTAGLPAANSTALANLANTTATTTNVGTPPSLLSQLAGAGTALYGVSQLLPKTKTAAVTP